MTWLWMAACCALFVELIVRVGLQRRAREMMKLVRKAGRVIASDRISDHWKELVLPRYSMSLLASSFLMFGTLLLAFSPFAVAGVITNRLDVPLLELLASFEGIIASCVFAIVYGRARAFLV